MSPIDDELRRALSGRAQAVTPAADPLAGIERRAKQIRRNRVGAAIAGSALAVAAVAAVVPAVQSGTSAPQREQYAEPTPTPAPETETSQYALDPANPWALRGTPVDRSTRNAIQEQYADVVRGREVRVTPLFAQVHESSQQLEVVFVAEVDGGYRWGVAQTSAQAPTIRWDEALPEPAIALAAALPGDEGVPRMLVVASERIGSIEYAADGTGEFTRMAEPSPRVATVALEGDPATDAYRLLDEAGRQVHQAAAPDPLGAQDLGPAPHTPELPDNHLAWPSRGSATPEQQEQVLNTYAAAVGATRDGVEGRLIYGGNDDTGRSFVLLQAWKVGEDAQTVGLITGGDQPDQPFLGPYLDKGPAVLAFLVPAGTGQTTDLLIVLPEPGTGEVLYAADDRTEPTPASSVEDGVWLVDRSTRPADDRLLVLDGDGDPDAPIYRGAVAPLLCGAKSCG